MSTLFCNPAIPPHASNALSVSFKSGVHGEWSEVTKLISPFNTRFHIPSKRDCSRIGGEHLTTGPISYYSSLLHYKYCVNVYNLMIVSYFYALFIIYYYL